MSVVIGGLYNHFKGNIYRVVCIAKHSESIEQMVIYQDVSDETLTWVRPYDMFVENVFVNGGERPRFKYIGNELQDLIEIYVELPKSIKQKFYDNGIDFEHEIVSCVESAEIRYEQTDADIHNKDLGLVILAAGASMSAILICISKLLRVINERPREVHIVEKNASGDVIKEETVLLEPSKATQKMGVEFEAGATEVKFKVLDQTK